MYWRRPLELRPGPTGFLEPVPGAAFVIERALEEHDLHSAIADLAGATDEEIARTASRYGLLGRLASLVAVEATQALALFLSQKRDGLAEAARAAAGAPDRLRDSAPASDLRTIDELAAALGGVLEGVFADLTASLSIEDKDLDQLLAAWDAAGTALDAPGAAGTVQRAVAAARLLTERQPQDGTALPEGLRSLAAAVQDASGAEIERMLRHAADAWRKDDLASLGQQMSELAGSVMPPRREPAGFDALGHALSVVNLVEGAGTSRHRLPRDFLRAALAQLLAWWSAEDVPDRVAPSLFPRVSDPSVWRTAFLMVPAGTAHAGAGVPLFDLARQDRLEDWRAFARECALWMEAANTLATAGSGPPSARRENEERLRDVVARLDAEFADRLGASGPPAAADGPWSIARTRARLLRLLAWRRRVAGIDPPPAEGLLGTEGRALISVAGALTAQAAARRCAWAAGCGALLPPGAHGNRKYCDAHRREAPRLRMRRSRSRD